MGKLCVCGHEVADYDVVCAKCGSALKDARSLNSPQNSADSAKPSGDTNRYVILGLILGATLGYLLRPSILLIGQLPFGVVITRGATLQGLDIVFKATAEASFNYVFIGLIAGGIIGYLVSVRRMPG